MSRMTSSQRRAQAEKAAAELSWMETEGVGSRTAATRRAIESELSNDWQDSHALCGRVAVQVGVLPLTVKKILRYLRLVGDVEMQGWGTETRVRWSE